MVLGTAVPSRSVGDRPTRRRRRGAARGRRRPAPAGEPSGGVTCPDDVAVVVDAADASPDALRRTLVSLGAIAAAPSFVVLVAEDDPVLASAVNRAGGRVRVDPAPDRGAAFWDAAVAEGRPFALWIDAGDVVTPATSTLLGEHFCDADVAIVQGAVGLANPDSFLHLRRGHDETAFERDVLLPALGAAGAAPCPWTGSGSMCRVGAIAEIGGVGAAPGACTSAGLRLHERRLTTRHEPSAVVRRTAPDTIDDYLDDRRRQRVIGCATVP